MHHHAWLTGCRVCVFAAAVAWTTGSASAAEPAPAAAAAEPTPSSHSILARRADLAAIGVEIYRQRLDTPGASMSFEVTVEKNSNAGQFVQAEILVPTTGWLVAGLLATLLLWSYLQDSGSLLLAIALPPLAFGALMAFSGQLKLDLPAPLDEEAS